MKYQDYIWDLGGTLLDNYASSTKAFCQTLEDFDRHITQSEVYAALKISKQYAIESFARDLPDFLSLYKAKEATYLLEPQLFVGAKEVLFQIKAAGGRNFLVSHRDRQVLTILETAGILSSFTEVITAENGFPRKPDPAALFYLKEKYQIKTALMIGDREIDVLAAQAAGLDAYLFDGRKPLLTLITE